MADDRATVPENNWLGRGGDAAADAAGVVLRAWRMSAHRTQADVASALAMTHNT